MKHVFGVYQEKSLSDFQVLHESHTDLVKVVENYIKELDEARRHGLGLTFLGPTGVGKTLLASIVLNEAVGHGYRIEAIELSTYVGLHKDKFSLQGLMKEDEQFIDHYIKTRQHIRYIQGITKHCADWVLFDDVGREFASDSGWSQGEFFDTVRSRWNRGLPTLLTSNLPMTELNHRYGEGLPSLLMEATMVLLVEGDDYRWKRVS
jgi:DNA replication protein DnaC